MQKHLRKVVFVLLSLLVLFYSNYFWNFSFSSLFYYKFDTNSQFNIETKSRSFKVFVYDVDPDFRANGLNTGNGFKSGILNPYHTNSQYMLTPLMDQLMRSIPERTMNPEEADLFFIPFYDTNKKFVEPITKVFKTGGYFYGFDSYWNQTFNITTKYIQRYKGIDHIIAISRPFWFLLDVNKLLYNPIYITLEWQFNTEKISFNKNILSPYPITDNRWQQIANEQEKVLDNTVQLYARKREQLLNIQYNLMNLTTKERPILIYFSGSKKAASDLRTILVRDLLSENCSLCVFDEIDRTIQNQTNGDSGFDSNNLRVRMSSSIFCLIPRGDSSTSRRLFNAIAAGCIPIIISNRMPLPYKNRIDYLTFTIDIHEEKFIVLNSTLLFELSSQLEKINFDVSSLQTTLLEHKEKFYYNGKFQLEILTKDNNNNPMLKESQLINLNKTNAFTMILDDLERIYNNRVKQLIPKFNNNVPMYFEKEEITMTTITNDNVSTNNDNLEFCDPFTCLNLVSLFWGCKTYNFNYSENNLLYLHSYWQEGPIQELVFLIKSYLVTQSLNSTRLIIWSNKMLVNSDLQQLKNNSPHNIYFKVLNLKQLTQGTCVLSTQIEEPSIELIRTILLKRYGGMWIDPKVYFLNDVTLFATIFGEFTTMNLDNSISNHIIHVDKQSRTGSKLLESMCNIKHNNINLTTVEYCNMYLNCSITQLSPCFTDPTQYYGLHYNVHVPSIIHYYTNKNLQDLLNNIGNMVSKLEDKYYQKFPYSTAKCINPVP